MWNINVFTKTDAASPMGFIFTGLCFTCAANSDDAEFYRSGSADDESCEECGDGQRREE